MTYSVSRIGYCPSPLLVGVDSEREDGHYAGSACPTFSFSFSRPSFRRSCPWSPPSRPPGRRCPHLRLSSPPAPPTATAATAATATGLLVVLALFLAGFPSSSLGALPPPKLTFRPLPLPLPFPWATSSSSSASAGFPSLPASQSSDYSARRPHCEYCSSVLLVMISALWPPVLRLWMESPRPKTTIALPLIR